MKNTSTPQDQFVGTEGFPDNEIVWEPLDGALPMKHTVKGSPKAGAIGGLIGLVWTIFVGQSILEALNKNASVPEILMLLLVALPGIFFLLYALSQFRYRHEFMIEHDKVTMVRQGLSGSKHWTEPLASYKGVLKQHQYRRDAGKYRTAMMVFTIKLAHDDKAKEVRLFESKTRLMSVPVKWENAWKRYANIIDLPLLEETEEGIVSSQPGQMDTPLQDKIRKGLIQVDRLNPIDTKLGCMVKVTQDGDAWVFTFQQAWTLWKAASGLIIMTVALITVQYLGFIDDELMRYFLFLIPFIIILICFSFQRKLKYPEQLAIDHGALWYRYWRKESGWTTRKLPISSPCSQKG